jgi:hypothetical protein
MGELGKAAAGHEPRYWLRVELGSKNPTSADVVQKVRTLLAEVSEELKL